MESLARQVLLLMGASLTSACCCGVPVSQLHAAFIPMLSGPPAHSCGMCSPALQMRMLLQQVLCTNIAMACCLVWQGGDLMDAIAKDAKGDLRWDRNGASLAIDVVRGLCHLHSKNVVSAQVLADVVCSVAQRG